MPYVCIPRLVSTSDSSAIKLGSYSGHRSLRGARSSRRTAASAAIWTCKQFISNLFFQPRNLRHTPAARVPADPYAVQRAMLRATFWRPPRCAVSSLSCCSWPSPGRPPCSRFRASRTTPGSISRCCCGASRPAPRRSSGLAARCRKQLRPCLLGSGFLPF